MSRQVGMRRHISKLKLFINDIPVEFIKEKKLSSKTHYDIIFSSKDKIVSKKLAGKVLVNKATTTCFDKLFKFFYQKKLKKLTSLTFAVKDKKYYKKFLNDQFRIVKAAGGLVKKNDQILMIHRLGKWDLPKGKLNKNERSKLCALREVEEECNIKVELTGKLCTTWHTYTRNNKRLLKRTKWYKMRCIDDSKMAPQTEEDIEEVKWMDKSEIREALENSYGTIKDVFRKYFK